MKNERAIQRIAPARVESCGSAEAYAAAVARCAAAGEAIADYGRLHHGLGGAPPAGHVQLDPPEGVIEHYVPDMAVRVAAGTTLGELQRRLAEQRQFLPIDGSYEMTIAEVVTHNVSGGLRAGNGSIRDLLLGLRYVDASGQLITVGGRTVKNVAGYDMTRLMVGSLNTLGLLAEVTLRTAAVPQQVTQATIDLDAADISRFMPHITDLLISDAAPWALWISHAYTPAEWTAVEFRYAGTALACDAQVRALQSWLAKHHLDIPFEPRTLTLFQDRYQEDIAGDVRKDSSAVVKLVVPPASTGVAFDAIRQLPHRVQHVHAVPTHGILHICAHWVADQAVVLDQQLTRLVQELGGIRIWLRRPDDDARLKPWAPAQDDWPILLRLKQALDPHNRFNPGRFEM